MNIIKKAFIFSFLAIILLSAPHAFAATPTLTLSSSGSGDGVLVSIHGDANSPIVLYYNALGRSGTQTQTIGNTDSGGGFWNVLNTGTYSIDSSYPVYVSVNNQQSASQSWPYVTNSNTQSGVLSLSQTSVVLSVGQSSTITANNLGNSSLYLSNNSNPSIATVSVSASQITVTANAYGSTVITVCVSGSNPLSCASIYVSIQNSNTQALIFSQNNVSIALGQSLPITVSGGTGIYTIANNSNSSIIQASLNNNTVTLYANSSSGSVTITVCSSDMSTCGIITATVGTSTSSGITFNQTNVSLGTSQSSTVTISGGSGTYSVSNNSNTNVVQTSISGNTLTLWGSTLGTATVTLCDTNTSCGSITVTVNSGGGGGNITLSQTSANVLVNQTLSITISGGTLPYSILSGQSSSVQTSLSGNVLNVTGINTGSGTISVCSASGGCTYLSVTVNGSSAGTAPTFSQSTISLNAGQSSSITIFGTGGYYVSGNSNGSIASVTISGNTATITALTAGASTISICQTAGQCGTVSVSVAGTTTSTNGSISLNPIISIGQTLTFTLSGPSQVYYYISSNADSISRAQVTGTTLTILGLTNGISSITLCASNGMCLPMSITVTSNPASGTSISTTPVSTSGTIYKFLNPLALGSSGTDVSQLQTRLTLEGFYGGPVTGYYGQLTVAAVQAYQAHYGLSALGNVGPATRAQLNR